MLKNLTYNGQKKFSFVTGLAVLVAYTVESLAKNHWPKLLLQTLIIVSLLSYCASMLLSIYCMKRRQRVMVDELSLRNEAEASKFVNLIVMLLFFVGLLMTFGNRHIITISYHSLFLLMVALPVLNNGIYLYLERGGTSDVNSDDED